MKIDKREWLNNITALYCANKDKILEQDCNMECQWGQCLCMDKEQLLIMQSLMDVEIIFGIELDGTLMPQTIEKDYTYCSKNAGFKKKLINCHGHKIDLKIHNQIERNIMASLPILQYINMERMIDTRQTLAYLCVFSNQGGDIFKAFMKAIVKRLCLEWPDRKKINQFVNAINLIFEEILRIYEEKRFKDSVSKLIKTYEDYSNVYYKSNIHNLVADIREADYNLQKKANDYDEYSNAFSWIVSNELDEGNGVKCLYHIVKILLKASESYRNNSMTEFFETNLSPQYEYQVYEEVENLVRELVVSRTKENNNEISKKIEKLLDDEF